MSSSITFPTETVQLTSVRLTTTGARGHKQRTFWSSKSYTVQTPFHAPNAMRRSSGCTLTQLTGACPGTLRVSRPTAGSLPFTAPSQDTDTRSCEGGRAERNRVGYA